jgi:hypothetical protein
MAGLAIKEHTKCECSNAPALTFCLLDLFLTDRWANGR